MNKITSIIRVLFYVVFGFVATLLIGSNLTLVKNVRLLSVQSGSMAPTLKTGDLILSLSNNETDYSPQDIIVFKSQSGNLVTHRVVTKQETESGTAYTTKGDANNTNDADLVKDEDILGQVKLAIPLLGRFVNFAKSGLGFVLLVVIPSFYIILTEAITIRDEVVKGRKGKGPPTELVSMLLLLTSLSLLGHLTYAFFTLQKESGNNVFAASNSFSTIFESSDYSCPEGDLTRDSNFGVVSFSFEGEDVNFTISLREASSSAEYDVTLQQEPGDCYATTPNFPAGITTDSQGNASGNFTLPQISTADNFWVEIAKEGHLLRSASVGKE